VCLEGGQKLQVTLLSCNEGKVLLDGNVGVDDVGAQARIQVVGTEVFFHSVVADNSLFGGKRIRTLFR